VSRQVHGIFARYTDLIEPLSLDEAYLDLTAPKLPLPSATAGAEAIRAAIREETGLTASAGVAPNKFLAKLASDWNKPDGLFVIRPSRIDEVLLPLPVDRIPGVGKVMTARLAALGVETVAQLRALGAQRLESLFGRWGRRLHELSHGIDEHPVEPDRPTLQISREDTLETDLPLLELEPLVRQLAARTFADYRRERQRDASRIARTITLKLKTSAFRILTRSLTFAEPPASAEALADAAWALHARVALPDATRYRLVGVGLSGFVDADAWSAQQRLFDPDEAE
ncbi:MAG: DNA polymerase IV, partial [Chiayiivirga sp.]|jgi:DNA polymerase-4|nr:DNA polymerase IV [Chiayiivirga sp.]